MIPVAWRKQNIGGNDDAASETIPIREHGPDHAHESTFGRLIRPVPPSVVDDDTIPEVFVQSQERSIPRQADPQGALGRLNADEMTAGTTQNNVHEPNLVALDESHGLPDLPHDALGRNGYPRRNGDRQTRPKCQEERETPHGLRKTPEPIEL